MDRSVGSPRTRSVVGVRGLGVSVFGLPIFMLREAFLNFPGRRVGGGGRVSPRPKKIKEMYEAELEFPEEVGRR